MERELFSKSTAPPVLSLFAALLFCFSSAHSRESEDKHRAPTEICTSEFAVRMNLPCLFIVCRTSRRTAVRMTADKALVQHQTCVLHDADNSLRADVRSASPEPTSAAGGTLNEIQRLGPVSTNESTRYDVDHPPQKRRGR